MTGFLPGQSKIMYGSSEFDPSVIQPTPAQVRAIGGFFGACSGLLVSKRCVLTAHHCGASVGWPFAGGPSLSYDVDPYGLVTDVVQLVHGEWHTGKDIALARLNKEVGRDVEPIPVGSALSIPRFTFEGQEYSLVQAVGYGQKGPGEPRTNYARTWAVGVIDWKRSADTYLYVKFNDDRNICYGDSGSPLLAMSGGRLVTVGVLSTLGDGVRIGDGCLGMDAFYTRADSTDAADFVLRYSSFLDGSTSCSDDPQPDDCPGDRISPVRPTPPPPLPPVVAGPGHDTHRGSESPLVPVACGVLLALLIAWAVGE